MSKATFRRLTHEQYQKAVHHLQIQEHNARRAYRVLVEGESMTAVALEEGVSKQLVNKQVGKVWAAFLSITEIPPSWRWVSVPLPPDEASKIERLSERLLSDITIS